MNLDITYEDENLIVINKESGLVVHPGAGNLDNTLQMAYFIIVKTNYPELEEY